MCSYGCGKNRYTGITDDMSIHKYERFLLDLHNPTTARGFLMYKSQIYKEKYGGIADEKIKNLEDIINTALELYTGSNPSNFLPISVGTQVIRDTGQLGMEYKKYLNILEPESYKISSKAYLKKELINNFDNSNFLQAK